MPLHLAKTDKNRRGMIMQVAAIILATFAALFGCTAVHAQDAIRVGDINSYKAMAANMGPYRKGVDLAADEINAAGGVLGKKFEIVSRDDGANPGDAVRVAEELTTGGDINILCGTFLSNVGLAV